LRVQLLVLVTGEIESCDGLAGCFYDRSFAAVRF